MMKGVFDTNAIFRSLLDMVIEIKNRLWQTGGKFDERLQKELFLPLVKIDFLDKCNTLIGIFFKNFNTILIDQVAQYIKLCLIKKTLNTNWF